VFPACGSRGSKRLPVFGFAIGITLFFFVVFLALSLTRGRLFLLSAFFLKRGKAFGYRTAFVAAELLLPIAVLFSSIMDFFFGIYFFPSGIPTLGSPLG